MLWASWAACTSGPDQADTANYFFGGDTGYCKGVFQRIGSTFGQIDVAAVPIGAYGGPSETWFHRTSHQNPEEAVMCLSDLNAQHGVAMHWGTFQLTAEPLLEPPARFKRAVQAAGVDENAYVVMGHGETRSFPISKKQDSTNEAESDLAMPAESGETLASRT